MGAYIPGNGKASRRIGAVGPTEVLAALEGLMWDNDGPEGIYVSLTFDPGGTTGWSVFGTYLVALGPLPFDVWLKDLQHNNVGEFIGPVNLEDAKLAWKAELTMADRYKILDNVAFWSAGEFGGTENAMVDAMLGLVDAWPASAPIIMEDFILRQFRQDAALLSPVRITAAFSYGVRRSFILQQPSLAMRMATDERLRVWNGGAFHNRTAGLPHARDAVRHNLTFLRREKQARSRGRSLLSGQA